MKIFVDENIPLKTVKELRLQGYDVVDIQGVFECCQPLDPFFHNQGFF